MFNGVNPAEFMVIWSRVGMWWSWVRVGTMPQPPYRSYPLWFQMDVKGGFANSKRC